jgi:tetratricopeptide (TPR) repeat protein
MHRWVEALDDSRRAQELAPNDPDVRRGAKVFERLGKFLAQIRELDARLAMTPEDDQLLADRALFFLRGQDYELALIDAEAAGQKAPWAMRPRLFRAVALIELGRASECEGFGVDPRLRFASLSPEFLETVGRLDAEILLERDNAELYISRAWQLNEIGQPKLALEDAETALRNDANSAAALVEASYALTKLVRKDDALQRISHATEVDPTLPTAWQYRGELEMAREDYPAAIISFSRVLALNQTTAALQKREQCYIKLGQYQQAEGDHRALEKLK